MIDKNTDLWSYLKQRGGWEILTCILLSIKMIRKMTKQDHMYEEISQTADDTDGRAKDLKDLLVSGDCIVDTMTGGPVRRLSFWLATRAPWP